MSYRLAKSLEKLRAQVNDAYPGRSKLSDGWIGDGAHASRTSDHNPWVMDNGTGVVTAFDITHDPKRGCDSQAIADALVASRDNRIKYIISNRRICASYVVRGVAAWVWRPYSGANAHSKHVHISVKDIKGLYDSEAPWHLPGKAAAAPASEPVKPKPAVKSAPKPVSLPEDPPPVERVREIPIE